MAVVEEAVDLGQEKLERMQTALADLNLDGWLLYDFRGNNPVAARVLGLPAMTRRWFVLVPASGPPVAITHRIEQQPWRSWIGENRPYLSWQELEQTLRETLSGRGSIAMEYSSDDGVPYIDRMPAGVLEMVRASGVTVQSSASHTFTMWITAWIAAPRAGTYSTWTRSTSSRVPSPWRTAVVRPTDCMACLCVSRTSRIVTPRHWDCTWRRRPTTSAALPAGGVTDPSACG